MTAPQLAVAGALTQVPDSWECVRLNRLCTPVTTRNASRDALALSLASSGRIYERTKEVDRQRSSEATEARGLLVRPDDLVVNPMWLIGGGIGVSRLSGQVSPDYRAYRPGPRLNPRYLHHVVRSEPYREQYRLWIRAETTFDRRISREDFESLLLPVPPLAEQARIADFLDAETDRLDRIVELRQQQVELANRARSAGLIEAFFDAGLPSVRLASVAEVAHGRQRSPEYETGPYMTRYIRSANVKDGVISLDDVKEMNFAPSERIRYGLRQGDVLVTEAAGSPEAIGASAMWLGDIDGPVCFQNHLLRLRPASSRWTSDYLYWWARASYAAGAMRVYATGANILNLGSESIRAMKVPRRSLEEQKAITQSCAALAEHYDALANASRRLTEALRERRQALVTAAVTGQLDVTSTRWAS